MPDTDAAAENTQADPGTRAAWHIIPSASLYRRVRGSRAVPSLAFVATVLVVIALWQNVGKKTQVYSSKPSAIIDAFRVWFTDPTLRSYIPVTLEEAALGLVIGVAAAVVIASLFASSRVVLEMFAPYLAVANAIPKIALAPLFLVIFGIGLRSKVYFVSVAIFFIPFQGLLHSLTTIDPVIRDNARMLGASKLALIRDVYIRAIVGSMTASLRITAAFALLATIVAELISSTQGIGFEIEIAQQNSQPNFLIAGIILIGVIGFAVDRILLLTERGLSQWQVGQ